jgi:hypothetical protein
MGSREGNNSAKEFSEEKNQSAGQQEGEGNAKTFFVASFLVIEFLTEIFFPKN